MVSASTRRRIQPGTSGRFPMALRGVPVQPTRVCREAVGGHGAVGSGAGKRAPGAVPASGLPRLQASLPRLTTDPSA